MRLEAIPYQLIQLHGSSNGKQILRQPGACLFASICVRPDAGPMQDICVRLERLKKTDNLSLKQSFSYRNQ